jgi:hypothetical protein
MRCFFRNKNTLLICLLPFSMVMTHFKFISKVTPLQFKTPIFFALQLKWGLLSLITRQIAGFLLRLKLNFTMKQVLCMFYCIKVGALSHTWPSILPNKRPSHSDQKKSEFGNRPVDTDVYPSRMPLKWRTLFPCFVLVTKITKQSWYHIRGCPSVLCVLLLIFESNGI